VFARAGAYTLGEEADTDSHQLAPLALLGLLAAQLVVAGDLHCLLQAKRVVARVVLPAGGRSVRELLGAQQVLHSQFGRVHIQLKGQAVDYALDGVRRFSDPERTRVRHATRGLVGVDVLHSAVRGGIVIAAGEDMEEAGRKLCRLSGVVERAMARNDVHLECKDLACLRCCDLSVHVVVGANEVDIRFSARSSTHLTGRPVRIDPTTART
jgi:hypothetical protein